jgi:hypothetical protein
METALGLNRFMLRRQNDVIPYQIDEKMCLLVSTVLVISGAEPLDIACNRLRKLAHAPYQPLQRQAADNPRHQDPHPSLLEVAIGGAR